MKYSVVESREELELTKDEPHAEPVAPARVHKSALHRALMVLRVLVPVLAIGYLLRVIPLHEVMASLGSMSLRAIVIAIALLVMSTIIATARWRLLFTACGLPRRPPYGEMLRAYWVGSFYNAYVPGGLGGDVVRGIATRGYAGERGLPAALGIVFLERTLGLAGLLIVVATSFTVFPLAGIPNVMLWSSLGLGAAASAVLAIVSGARLAPYLPAPLGRIAASLPTVRSLPLFCVALGMSVLTQLAGVIFGHVLIASITPLARWSDSLVILPLVNAAQYFPLTIGGAGAREAAFVLLYARVGVSQADALATSLVIGALMYATSAVGGVLHAIRPLALDPNAVPAER